MSTTPAPAFGDIQKQIQDKVAQIRTRIADLKTKLPFTPPGILPTLPNPILSRTSMQGGGRLGNLRILSGGGGNILKRPLLMRGQSNCPGCNPQGMPAYVPPTQPNLNPAIVDIRGNARIPSGAAVAEDIDPTHLDLSIST